MEAEIITIGDEILIGQTIDTNSAWLGKTLNKYGIDVRQTTSIRDTRESIIEQLEKVSNRVDLIIITGGLGPTRDDVTKNVLCEYFDTTLKRNEEVLRHIEEYFSTRGRVILESNRRQADLPIDCTILRNKIGTASGMWFEKDTKVFISLPGVPYEMQHIFKEKVLPRLPQYFDLPSIVHYTIMTEGIGESFLAEYIKDWEAGLSQDNIKIAYLPSPGMVKIRLSAYGKNKAVLEEKINRKAKELADLIPTYIYGENDESAEANIAALLIGHKKTVATAESCTGGYLAHLLTAVPGSSAYFLGSVIAYSNRIKNEQLAVSKADLEKHGAVSRKVVEQMALNAREKMGVDFALATSGVAGPDGGSEEKPVGTVWISIASDQGVYAKKYLFEKDRSRNIKRAAYAAISILRRSIKGQLKVGS